ncbi:MAG: asparagine synthase (glutamine-hydrolyzing) [Planctomycetota bacterium]
MCGIAGCVGSTAVEIIEKMSAALTHRGPDDHGTYVAPNGKVTFGHRRLSIIDLAHGQQPLSNEDGTVWVSYNGEIYNHAALRDELVSAGHRFATTCDTEVLVHGWEEWGSALVERLNGNFAFAIHDQKQDVVFLARDRMGIRPLFYCEVGGSYYFASEIKALLAVPGVDFDVDPRALDQYLSLRYSFGEHTMLRGVRRLPPGSTMTIDRNGARQQRYWKIQYQPQPIAEDDAADQLDALLQDSVSARLMSDVPLGMYLSGGLDSALILALMAKQTSTPVRTFSLGFGLDLDETGAAKTIADHFGAQHTELRLPADSYRELPNIVKTMDEPLGDMIVVPTYFLSRTAQRDVKVVLTGEGADEIFGSYVHHYLLTWFERYRKWCPRPLRALQRGLVGITPTRLLDLVFPYPGSLGAAGKERLRGFLREAEDGNGYLPLVQMYAPREKQALYAKQWRDEGADQWRSDFDLSTRDGAVLNRLIAMDSSNWLPDYTLFKQDRLTMANSIEGRVPYLDHRLVEFAARLPVGLKQKGLQAKALLRRVADRYLPPEIARRKKAAFYLPVTDFYGPDFCDFVRDTLSQGSVAADGFFDPSVVARLTERGLGGDLLPSKRLMAIFIFTLWARQLRASDCR